MPRLIEETPLGWRIEMDTGEQYDVPNDVAMQSFPDLFAQPEPQQNVININAPMSDPSQMMGQADPIPQNPYMQPQPDPGYMEFPEDQLPPDPGYMEFPEDQLPVAPADPGYMEMPEDQLPPAAAQPTSTSVRVERDRYGYPKMDPRAFQLQEGDLAGYESAVQGGLEAGRRAMEAQQAATRGQAEFIGEQVLPEREQMQQKREEFDIAAEQMLADKEAAIDEARAAIPTMNPGRVWNNMSGFQQAASLLGAAAAGFLNPGGDNQVVNQMNKLIEMDMKAQETDIQTARYNLLSAERGFDRMMSKTQRQRGQLIENQMFRLDSLAAEMQKKMMDAQDPILAAQYEQWAMKVIEGAEMKRLELKQFNIARRLDWAKMQFSRARDVMAMKTQRAAIRARKAPKPTKAPEPLPVFHDPVTGRTVVVSDRRTAATMDKGEFGEQRSSWQGRMRIAGAVKDFKQQIASSGRVYQGPGKGWRWNPDVDDLEFIDAQFSRYMVEMFAIAGQHFTDSEQKLFRDQLGEVRGLVKGGSMDTAMQILDDTLRSYKKQNDAFKNTYKLREEVKIPAMMSGNKDIAAAILVGEIDPSQEVTQYQPFTADDEYYTAQDIDAMTEKQVKNSIGEFVGAVNDYERAKAEGRQQDMVKDQVNAQAAFSTALSHIKRTEAPEELRDEFKQTVQSLGLSAWEILGPEGGEQLEFLLDPESLDPARSTPFWRDAGAGTAPAHTPKAPTGQMPGLPPKGYGWE